MGLYFIGYPVAMSVRILASRADLLQLSCHARLFIHSTFPRLLNIQLEKFSFKPSLQHNIRTPQRQILHHQHPQTQQYLAYLLIHGRRQCLNNSINLRIMKPQLGFWIRIPPLKPRNITILFRRQQTRRRINITPCESLDPQRPS
jgi:hypothetical protein